jgi:hypothetical protein
MIPRRWFPKWRHPARNQMSFWFLVSPEPLYWTPPEPLRRSRPRGRANVPPFRPPRARSDPTPSQDRVERVVDRWVRRGVGCAICHHWPAPCHHRVRDHVFVICRACAARPDTVVRLEEIALVDWRETPEPV